MTIEPLCLLRKRCPVAAQLLIGKLDERVSCLLRKFSRTMCFATVLICSSSHAQPTSVRALPFPPRSGSRNRVLGSELAKRIAGTGAARA
jgi:hypothetical protein